MENQAGEQQSYEDVQKSGYLRKHKSMHRRFFVLRAASEQGPARLEYYENEKKFRSKSPVPKKTLNLETCFNINKRADSKNKHMIVLYTRSESFAIAADTEEVQDEWYQAMLDLQCNFKAPDDWGSSGECSSPSPVPTFKEVWQVKVWPKGLGHARNLVGIYRLCLTDKTVNFVKLNSEVASVVLQLMNVRRCGHSENFFFIEVGRSAVTGPGEFWMQVEDSVVAQHMHETLLEAMKALSEEFRQRSKSQSVGTSCGGGTASNPISAPSRRHHPNLPPSQVGFSRRARTETPGTGGSSTSTSPTSRHGFPRARTASIGARSEEGGACGKGTWASSSPSLNSSCSTTPTLRPKPTRAPTPAKITLSLARYTPNPTPSPAPSLSSSSGHGSECGLIGAAAGGMAICSYPRAPQRVSVSGSPSDYGSSDEYGSSPGEHSLMVPNLPGASHGIGGHLGHGEGPASYLVMGHREGLLASGHRSKGRRILRRSSGRECEAERRLLSKRASLPSAAAHDRLGPRRKDEDEEDDEEYAVMCRSPNNTTERPPGPGGCPGGGGGGPPAGDASSGEARKSGGVGRGDGEAGGYMAMVPGGAASPPGTLALAAAVGAGAGAAGAKPAAADEYMAMTPNNSTSSPQPIPPPGAEGYMLMSPNGGSSDLQGLVAWGSRSSVESRPASDYMNVSPGSSRSACSTPPSHPEQHPLQPKMFNSYFSLPRAYQHTLYTRFEDDLSQGQGGEGGAGHEGTGTGGGGGYSKRNKMAAGPAGSRPLSLSSSSFSSSSASSESLEDKSLVAGRGLSVLRAGGACAKDGRHARSTSGGKGSQQGRRSRPPGASSDMAKANTLPRARENLQPSVAHSVGEYVSIQYGEDGEYNGRRRSASRHGQAVHGPLGPLDRSVLCRDSPTNLSRSFSAPLSASAEYVSMEVGRSSASPRTPARSKFTTPPAASPKSRDGRSAKSSPLAAEGHSSYRTSAALPTDTPKGPDPPSKSSSSNTAARPQAHSGQLPFQPDPSLGFSPIESFSSPGRSGRLARGDSQGLRSPRAGEAFGPTPSMSSLSALYPEAGQSAAHRPAWDCSSWEGGQAAGSAVAPAQADSFTAEPGLNYVDLDLAMAESPQAGVEHASAPYNMAASGLGSSAGASLNTYASIDFYKSEERRGHQTSRKDIQGRR
ncbi:insulin receptor substrate 1 [Gadus chalcogrammus]|uniref:insulin receptor substrate 1 n=1 Tax=Gadus chalcogrammus TaxID=1042646 RepID=UPI0024C4BF00|nr:insulin receptor substrate 1 [Gadus chalcogrammus]